MLTDLLIFNISGQELIFILFAVVLLFGSKRIPEIARGLGQGIKYVRNATNEIKQEINKSAENDPGIKEAKDALNEGREAVDEVVDSVKRNTKI